MKDAYKNTAALFESALEAVIGTDGEQVVFMNPAAVSALGEHRGEALSSLLPAEVLGLVPGQVAALTLCGRRASLRAASAPGLKVFFVAFDEPQKSLPERAGFLPELRSLLSGLKLAADRLSEAAEAAGGQEALERTGLLQHTCAQLQRLVGNTALAEDIESRSVHFRPENLDLAQLCRETVWTVEFFARARGIEAVYSGPEEPVRLTADRAMLETLLLNLLSNSLQHLGSGGRVEVSVSQLGSRVILSVDDNGEGMSSEQLARLFTGGASGAGLGLRLVRDIAQLHGGAFIIEGREGLGASARVMFPTDNAPRSTIFRSPGPGERHGGMNSALIQLSAWLSAGDYDPRLLD